jgi:hypothetical protein
MKTESKSMKKIKFTKKELNLIKKAIKTRNSFKCSTKPKPIIKFMIYTGLCFRARLVHRFCESKKEYEPIYIFNYYNPIAWCVFLPITLISIVLQPIFSSVSIIELIKELNQVVSEILNQKLIWYKGRAFVVTKYFKYFHLHKIKLELGEII